MDALKAELADLAREYAIKARVRKGPGGGDDRFRDELASLFDGAPEDRLVDALLRIGRRASRLECASSALLLSPARGVAARALGQAIARSAWAASVAAANERGPLRAKQAIVELLAFEASATDAALDAILDAFLEAVDD